MWQTKASSEKKKFTRTHLSSSKEEKIYPYPKWIAFGFSHK